MRTPWNAGSDLAGFVPASYDEVVSATAMWDTDGTPGAVNAALFPTYALSRSSCDARDDTYVGFSNFATLPTDRARLVAGACPAGPAAIREKLVEDAADYNVQSPGYGFLGDPIHPLDPSHFYSGNYVGCLVNASLY